MTRARLGILISGTGDNMAALIDAAKAPDCPWTPVLVLSNVADAPGLARAAAAGVPARAIPHRGSTRAAHDAAMDGALRAAGATHVALAGYMRILTEPFVAAWAGRMVNIHPSLLPAYKGLDTHARALADGVREHGASVHLVTAGLDDGPVLGQARVPVLAGDTPATLGARVKAAELTLYPRVLREWLRDAAP